MTNHVLVFDFDGTLTVPVTGADATFLHAYQAGLAEFMGKRVDWVAERFAHARTVIADNPEQYGWEIDGRIVAPALVDEYVEALVCAQFILKEIGEHVDIWTNRLESLYRMNYLKHQTAFRFEVLETFRELRKRDIPFAIVTNSHPGNVRDRLISLGKDAEWVSPLVYGNAKKFVVTPGPSSVPQKTAFPGLERPIFLRKQKYYDVLIGIMETYSVSWDGLIVIGDIAELDLAMPVTMGARGHLVLGPNTPPCERRWAEKHPLAGTITNLHEAVP